MKRALVLAALLVAGSADAAYTLKTSSGCTVVGITAFTIVGPNLYDAVGGTMIVCNEDIIFRDGFEKAQ